MPRQLMTELKVGIFVCIGLALAMVIIFMIGSDHAFLTRQYTVYAHFSDISGLRKGAPVQLAGLKVGFVDDIRFPFDPAQRNITIVLRLQKEYQNRIREDSLATIETQGLLGDKFIYVSVGSEQQPVVPNRGIIQTRQTTSIFALADKAGKIMDDIGAAAESLNEVLGTVKGQKGEGDVKAIVSSVRRSIEQIEKGKGLAHAIIYEPKGEEVVSNLADTMKSLKEVISGAEEESKGQMGGLIVNLRHASADLRQILDNVRRGEGTFGRLVNDPALYDDLRALVGRANRNKLLRAVVRSTIRENDRQVLK